tara:strand:+ start:12003 stop:12422 length:420 start_codon:yes stop_codon:yes gene_type:complete
MASTKDILIKGGAVLVGTLALALIGKTIVNSVVRKRKGKAQDKIDMDVDSGSSSDDASDYNPSSDVTALGGYIYGNNFWTYEEEVDAIIIPMSDARLKKLSEAYKKQYGIGLYANLIGECCYGMYEESEARLKSLGLTS